MVNILVKKKKILYLIIILSLILAPNIQAEKLKTSDTLII